MDTIKSISNPVVHAGVVTNPDGSDINSILPTGAATSAKQNDQITLLQGIAGFTLSGYDYISLTQATLTDTWTFKTGGSGGTTVATVVITYTDSAKETISNIAKT